MLTIVWIAAAFWLERNVPLSDSTGLWVTATVISFCEFVAITMWIFS